MVFTNFPHKTSSKAHLAQGMGIPSLGHSGLRQTAGWAISFGLPLGQSDTSVFVFLFFNQVRLGRVHDFC